MRLNGWFRYFRVFRNLSLKKKFWGPGKILVSRIMFVLEKFGFKRKNFGLEKGFGS